MLQLAWRTFRELSKSLGQRANFRELGRLAVSDVAREKTRKVSAASRWDEAYRAHRQTNSRHDPEALGVLRHLARRDERGLLHGAKGRALSRHEQRGQRRAPLPCAQHRRHETRLGVAATTCSYKDWYGTDLIIFFGANPANDQPVTTKYLHEAKKLGTKVVMVNPYREPGMERYWVPSTSQERAVRHGHRGLLVSRFPPAATSRSSAAC